MAHNPINHPARPIYRALGGLIGLYLVIFGVLGLIDNSGAEFFAQDENARVLGQGANLGSSVILAALGGLILIGTAIGRNIDARLNKYLGYAFMIIGLANLAVLRTDANFLNFTVVTCVVVMLLGTVLLMAGMYGRVGTDKDAEAWQKARLVL
jgi:hypothetical protein